MGTFYVKKQLNHALDTMKEQHKAIRDSGGKVTSTSTVPRALLGFRKTPKVTVKTHFLGFELVAHESL